MTNKQLEKLEKLLDERREFALYTDKQMGNEFGCFLENNPDYIYYKGMLEIIHALGIEYEINNGKHELFL